jgi:CDP-diacylglycerol--glycerol-3-phosphate 3-phosphatidyltransferase
MNLANNLTFIRLILVPVFIGCLFYYTPHNEALRQAALLIFVGACLTDAVDGFVARRKNQVTTLGSYLDPLADKALLISGFACLGFMTHLPQTMRIPAWVSITVISRDLLILLGAVMIYLMSGSLKVKPLLIGKTTTFFQMLTIFCTLCAAPLLIQSLLFYITFGLTILSGLQYLHLGAESMQSSER